MDALLIGTCKLCRLSRELKDSHMLPSAAYKLIQGTTNDPPIIINGELAIHTNQQIKAHMLCADCEERFSKNGESWVLQHCFSLDFSTRALKKAERIAR